MASKTSRCAPRFRDDGSGCRYGAPRRAGRRALLRRNRSEGGRRAPRELRGRNPEQSESRRFDDLLPQVDVVTLHVRGTTTLATRVDPDVARKTSGAKAPSVAMHATSATTAGERATP